MQLKSTGYVSEDIPNKTSLQSAKELVFKKIYPYSRGHVFDSFVFDITCIKRTKRYNYECLILNVVAPIVLMHWTYPYKHIPPRKNNNEINGISLRSSPPIKKLNLNFHLSKCNYSCIVRIQTIFSSNLAGHHLAWKVGDGLTVWKAVLHGLPDWT